jgi:hypothetical protein
MSNRALTASTYFINKHGVLMTYVSKGASVYNVETLSSTTIDRTLQVRVYPKHITADRQSYPDLINKELIMFYIAYSDNLIPKQNDSITYNGKNFIVDRFQSHMYNGKVCLYKVLGYA